MIKIADCLLTGVVYLAILSPLFLLFILIKKPADYRPLKLFVLFVFINVLFLIGTSGFIGIPGSHWNWTGKIASFIAALACIYFSGYSFKDAGLSFTFKKNWWIVFAIALAYYIYKRILPFDGHWPGSYSAETIAFQATMPGLEEETWFRGIYLLLLNKLFGRPVHIGKLQFGAAVFITAALFGIVHGVEVHNAHFNVQWSNMTGPFISGIIWGLVTEAAGNIWPAVFLHNSSNTINYLLGYFK